MFGLFGRKPKERYPYDHFKYYNRVAEEDDLYFYFVWRWFKEKMYVYKMIDNEWVLQRSFDQ